MTPNLAGSLIGASQKELTMSSREIADILGSHHDNVKRTVERLVERGVFDVPPMVEDQIETSHGRKHATSAYQLQKRDSYVVVAQLSPEFTARLVDRWQELEQQAGALPNFANPAEAARAWADCLLEQEGGLWSAVQGLGRDGHDHRG